MAIIVGDEVDRETQVPETTRAADAVQICLGVLREIEVDDHVHGLDIDTAGEQIWRNDSRRLAPTVV